MRDAFVGAGWRGSNSAVTLSMVLSRRLSVRALRGGAPGTSRIAEYDPAAGPLAGWLWTVLDNLWKDQLRSASRRHPREQELIPSKRGTNPWQTVEDPDQDQPSDELDRTTPFNDRDRAEIAEWPVLDRVLVLTVFDLWRKIASDTWELWCVEAGLPLPFPPSRTFQRNAASGLT